MSIESDVVDILKKTPAGVSFTVDVISINKTQMAAVAAAIEKNDIKVEVADTGSLGAAYSSFASRKWDAGEKKLIGKITLGNAKAAESKVGKASIFHESVHALMDVKGLKVSMHNDEVVAYLADALYLRKTQTGIAVAKDEMKIYDAAFAIIAKHKMLRTAGVSLKWTDCDALREAIKAHPSYAVARFRRRKAVA